MSTAISLINTSNVYLSGNVYTFLTQTSETAGEDQELPM